MNAGRSSTQEISVDVLPPVPGDTALPSGSAVNLPPVPFEGLRTFYHPASGVVILGIDILAFGPEFLSGFLDVPIMCVLAFLATFPVVYIIQWRWAKNSVGASLGKAFLGAFLAGLPFSIAGTLLGAAVIALAGLPHHPLEMLKRLTGPAPVRH